MLTEQRVVLKQEAMSGVWIDGEQGVRQSLRQDKSVHGRYDEVIAATRNEDGLHHFSQMRVRSVFVAIPPGQGRSFLSDQLSLCNTAPKSVSYWVPHRSFRDPFGCTSSSLPPVYGASVMKTL